MIASLGLVACIVGVIATVAFDSWSEVDPAADGTMPGTVRFEADRSTYEVLLVRRRGSLESEVANTRCLVVLADGARRELDGRFQTVSVSGGGTATVGSFDAVPGSTAVRCEGGDAGRRFVIDAVSRWERWTSRAMWLGAIAFALGLGTGFAGWFWRRQPSPA